MEYNLLTVHPDPELDELLEGIKSVRKICLQVVMSFEDSVSADTAEQSVKQLQFATDLLVHYIRRVRNSDRMAYPIENSRAKPGLPEQTHSLSTESTDSSVGKWLSLEDYNEYWEDKLQSGETDYIPSPPPNLQTRIQN